MKSVKAWRPNASLFPIPLSFHIREGEIDFTALTSPNSNGHAEATSGSLREDGRISKAAI